MAAGDRVDLGPYFAILDAVQAQGGAGGTVRLDPEERKLAEMRRLSMAARRRGLRLVWLYSSAEEISFRVVARPKRR
jgi:hypothetical protein